MKKHLVMIVGGYFPLPSPTGKCADQYISLVEDAYTVDVICIAKHTNKSYQYNKKTVFPVGCKYVYMQGRVSNRILRVGSKILLRIWNSFHQPNNLNWYVKAANRKLKEINDEKNIDLIFSIGAPMASHCAAMRFKSLYPKVRWVTYSADSYAAQNSNRRRALRFEKKVLSQADYNLLSEEIYKNNPFLYQDNPNRFGTLPYLLPKVKCQIGKISHVDFDKINIVYAGSFYKKIRNPLFLLETFMCTKSDAVLHLFCTSDCDELIDQIVKKSCGKIVRHKPVDAEEIGGVYSAANILVSVGNSLPEFKPSKIFEYIATGKPIMNVFYDGLRDEILDEYPLAIQICNSEEKMIAAEQMDAFILANAFKNVAIDEINGKFKKHTQASITTVLSNALNGVVGE